MKTVNISKPRVTGVILVAAFTSALACSSDPTSPAGGTGGSPSSNANTGGTASATGGAASVSGGTASSTGGTPVASGGASATTGGIVGQGGQASTGGTPTSGGTPATGGTMMGGQPVTAGGGSTGGGSGGASTGGATSGKGGASTGGKGGAGNGGAGGTQGGAAAGGSGGASDPVLAKFSFFVVSYPTLIRLSGKTEGFGGDLRFNKTDGLSGADEICRQAAEIGMVGAGQKTWRAFLSATQGPGGMPVNARDRIGTGPWYDRMGRLLAMNLDGLFAGDRPSGDAALVSDFTNEKGEPNHYVGPNGVTTSTVDNHDTLTGSDAMGRLMATSAAQTCNDWTSTTVQGSPRVGHSWPRSATSGRSWVSDHTAPGCVAGVDRTLGGAGSGSCIGCAGGYGGFYCFAVP